MQLFEAYRKTQAAWPCALLILSAVPSATLADTPSASPQPVSTLDVLHSPALLGSREVDDFLLLIDGIPRQLSGNRLPLSPQNLAAIGLVYGAGGGLHGALTANYVGRHYLDMRNRAAATAYTTCDISLGYRLAHWDLALKAENLGDRRDPVLESELGEGQYYRLGGRRLTLTLTLRR